MEQDGEAYHFCKITEVKLYWKSPKGVEYRRSEGSIAKDQTDICTQSNLNPYTTAFERVGDVLRLKRQ